MQATKANKLSVMVHQFYRRWHMFKAEIRAEMLSRRIDTTMPDDWEPGITNEMRRARYDEWFKVWG